MTPGEAKKVDELVEHGFPYPVATRWRAWTQDVSPTPERVFGVAEVMARQLVVLAMAEWLHRTGDSPIEWSFQERRTLGGCLRLHGDLVGFLRTGASGSDPLTAPELLRWDTKDGTGASPRHLAEKLVALRNQSAHDDFRDLHPARLREVHDEAAAVLRSWAKSLAWLARYRLGVVVSHKIVYRGEPECAVRFLRGFSETPQSGTLCRGSWTAPLGADEHRVLLFDATAERALDLSPLLEVRWNGRSQLVYMWTRFQGKAGTGTVVLSAVEAVDERESLRDDGSPTTWESLAASRPDTLRAVVLGCRGEAFVLRDPRLGIGPGTGADERERGSGDTSGTRPNKKRTAPPSANSRDEPQGLRPTKKNTEPKEDLHDLSHPLKQLRRSG